MDNNSVPRVFATQLTGIQMTHPWKMHASLIMISPTLKGK